MTHSIDCRRIIHTRLLCCGVQSDGGRAECGASASDAAVDADDPGADA